MGWSAAERPRYRGTLPAFVCLYEGPRAGLGPPGRRPSFIHFIGLTLLLFSPCFLLTLLCGPVVFQTIEDELGALRRMSNYRMNTRQYRGNPEVRPQSVGGLVGLWR